MSVQVCIALKHNYLRMHCQTDCVVWMLISGTLASSGSRMRDELLLASLFIRERTEQILYMASKQRAANRYRAPVRRPGQWEDSNLQVRSSESELRTLYTKCEYRVTRDISSIARWRYMKASRLGLWMGRWSKNGQVTKRYGYHWKAVAFNIKNITCQLQDWSGCPKKAVQLVRADWQVWTG